jgi:hypothetical protein
MTKYLQAVFPGVFTKVSPILPYVDCSVGCKVWPLCEVAWAARVPASFVAGAGVVLHVGLQPPPAGAVQVNNG